jgi:hypothetical protein
MGTSLITARNASPESDFPGHSDNWVACINRGLNHEQLDAVRTSGNRGRPFASNPRVQRIAKRLGLEFTLRGPGRLRINSKNL